MKIILKDGAVIKNCEIYVDEPDEVLSDGIEGTITGCVINNPKGRIVFNLPSVHDPKFPNMSSNKVIGEYKK